MFKIDEQLNLVMPLYHGDDIYAWVHSVPLPRAVFEANYRLVAKTFTELFADGIANAGGVRIAQLVMRDIATEDGSQDKYQAFIAEIRRITSVLLPSKEGWSVRLLHDAIHHKLIDEDDSSLVENALVFFTVFSAMLRRQMRLEMLPGAVRLWGAQISSLSVMALKDTLPTLTTPASSPEEPAVQQVPM